MSKKVLYYHGTRKANLKLILIRGLDPMLAHPNHIEDEKDYFPRPPHHFVYLTYSPNLSKDYGLTILEINMPTKMKRKLIFKRGEFVRCPFLIKPEWIRVMSKGELQ